MSEEKPAQCEYWDARSRRKRGLSPSCHGAFFWLPQQYRDVAAGAKLSRNRARKRRSASAEHLHEGLDDAYDAWKDFVPARLSSSQRSVAP